MHLLQYFLPTYFFCKCIQRNHMKLPHFLSHTYSVLFARLLFKREGPSICWIGFVQCRCTAFITNFHHHQIYYRILPAMISGKWLANSYNIRWIWLTLICLWSSISFRPLLRVLFSYQMHSEWPWSDQFRNNVLLEHTVNNVERTLSRFPSCVARQVECLDLFPRVCVTYRYDISNHFVASISLISRERDRSFF